MQDEGLSSGSSASPLGIVCFMFLKNFQVSQRNFSILSVLIGALAGHFLFHPFSDLVNRFIIKHSALNWHDLEITTLRAVGFREFSLAYSAFGALIGYFYARTVGMQRETILQLQRFSKIGMDASSIIHDLGNPLTGISWFAELIERRSAEPETQKNVKMIKKSVEEISEMMLDIKTLASDSSRFTLNRVRTDLQLLARKVASTMKLHCDILFTSTDEVHSRVDPAYFERVFWNLFKNADEAMEGKPDARVAISMWNKGTAVTIRIEDNGPGIMPELAKRLLRFGETYGKKGGSGIGLYNCKKIVEAHGGKLWFTSKANEGTSFFISLPE
jgi:signal transduction histidine kinase